MTRVLAPLFLCVLPLGLNLDACCSSFPLPPQCQSSLLASSQLPSRSGFDISPFASVTDRDLVCGGLSLLLIFAFQVWMKVRPGGHRVGGGLLSPLMFLKVCGTCELELLLFPTCVSLCYPCSAARPLSPVPSLCRLYVPAHPVSLPGSHSQWR